MRRRAIVALLFACATARLLVGGRVPAGRALLLHLPASLAGQPGVVAPLDRSERVLAASPGVKLERRTYGSTQVALLTVAGLKELHPPTVCLKAAGFEVTERGEEESSVGCLAVLRLRRAGSKAHFFYTYFDGQRTTCSFWSRAARGALAQLAGRRASWSTLQVMDSDAARARRALTALLEELRSERRRAAATDKLRLDRGAPEGREQAQLRRST